MALEIDNRLLEPDGKAELTENFNRVMKAVDAASGSGGDIDALQQEVATLKTEVEALKTSTSGIPTMQSAITQLQSDLAALTERVAALEGAGA